MKLTKNQSRLELMIKSIKRNIDRDADLAATLQEWDLPDWICIAESVDHLKIWDAENGSSQLGFITVFYPKN
jgi:hypothetical protein